jgi:hypothetical protein
MKLMIFEQCALSSDLKLNTAVMKYNIAQKHWVKNFQLILLSIQVKIFALDVDVQAKR